MVSSVWPKCTEYRYRSVKTAAHYNQLVNITLQLYAIQCSIELFSVCFERLPNAIRTAVFLSSYSVNFVVHYKRL